MKNMSSTVAHAILGAIVDPSFPAHRQTLIDATDHPDDGVVESGLSLIKYVSDKSPFETVLIKHAMDHSKSGCAAQAYEAMAHAQDLTPFYPAIQAGCKAANHEIALGALYPIFICAMDCAVDNNSLPSPLNQAVIDAMDHPDDRVAADTLASIEYIPDKTPFAAALQKMSATRPSLKAMADGILSRIAFSSYTPPAPTENQKPSVIKGVRLDFNIETNGAGKQLHISDAVARLTGVFAKSTPVPAEVFYDPGKTLPERGIVEIILSEDDKERVLAETLQGIAPAFDLVQKSPGKYNASLSPIRALPF